MLSLLALLSVTGTANAAAPKYLHFPDVYGDKVVFSYAGDLWLSSTKGGKAVRLTSGAGAELFAKFSPDGKWIAFTGQYGGDEQVYVIPAEGGAPRQLTFQPSMGPLDPRQGYDNRVNGWTPDGKSVLFRSLRDQPGPIDGRLYTVALSDGKVIALPMYRAGKGVYAPDGKSLLFSTLSTDFRTWKHYEGGLVQHQYILDFGTKKLTQLQNNKRSDTDGVWNSRGIFFLSERDGRANLYRYDPATSAATAVTHFTDADAKFASGDAAGKIVFELEGAIHLYDATTGTETALNIDVPAEDTLVRPHVVNVSRQIEQSALSPKGQRVLFVARGDIFVKTTAEDGAVLNLTHSSNAHEREAAWSPDGNSIAFVSDASGEEEIWTVDASGTAPAHQLTHGRKTRYYEPKWSPDGRKLAVMDDRGNLVMVDRASGAKTVIGTTKAWYARQYEWSPDSRYLAYAQIQPSDMMAIQIWDSSSNKTELVTDPQYSSFQPAWSPDGNYLWFLSVRDVNLQIAETEWNFAANKQTRVFALALQENAPPLFSAPSGNEEAQKDKQAKAAPIEFKGLAQRLIRAPLEPDNYTDLSVGKGQLFYRVTDEVYFGNWDANGTLYSYDLSTKKAKKLKEGASFYSANLTNTDFLVRDDKRVYSVVHLNGDPDKIDISSLSALVYPRQEWAEAYEEAWRRYREFFYDPKMHGRDWAAIGAHYRAQLPGIGNRMDLNYLIGEMIAELGVGHAYVTGGAEDTPDRPRTGLLGARFAFDETRQQWVFTHILEGDNADPTYRSPLTAFGTEVKAREALLAIDGQPVGAEVNPYTLLAGKAERTVEILVGDAAGKTRKIRIKTLSNEAALMRFERSAIARRTVDKLSGGTIGYVHLADMGPTGLREFVKDWFGQIRKDGIIVDIRGNQGGQVSRIVLERLIRQAYTRGYIMGLQIPQTYPWGGYTQAFTGEIDMLANETTMSDGDTMSWTFKQTGRGRLIGKRTWGGVIGIGDTGSLIDGGTIYVPQYALAGPNGEWIVEGEGVSPDIEVDNDQPYLMDGRDAQLETAVKDLQSRIKGHPGTLQPPKPVPPKP
ncbi:S41 family peptidase [Rhizomicrobium palustre]